jgi:activator of HSP90 ATPase
VKRGALAPDAEGTTTVAKTYEFEQSATIPASPKDVYEAWMSGAGHTAMTGAAASVDPVVGGEFTAWDGYIRGRNLVLEPYRRIVQSWRTSEFSDADADSQIEVTLEPIEEGTLLRLRHSGVPVDHHGYEDGGWESNYFEPMATYFSTR